METRAWRAEILEGVESVPSLGTVDTLVVYGENAEAILSGRNAPRVFMAAALYGKGRLVVFSGRSYTKEMEMPSHNVHLAKLRSNVLKWLCPGQQTHRVINITDEDDVDVNVEVGQNPVLLWQVEHPRKSAKFIDDVKKHIQDGGGAIFTKTPTGFEYRHGSLDKSPIYHILHEAGIYFRLHRADVRGVKLVAENEAHISHLGRAIEECLKDPRKLTVYGSVIGFAVDGLPNKKEVKNKLRKLLDEVDSLGIRYVPRGPTKKVKTAEGINLAHFVHSFLWDPESGKGIGCENFPGDFNAPPDLVCIEVFIDSKKFSEVHPTGAYLPPGEIVKVEVIEGDVGGWEVRVGAQSDRLDKQQTLKRWPILTKTVKLQKPMVKVFNPFGGLVYLVSPSTPRKIRVRLSNVVESPLYNIKEETSSDSWKLIKERPGLWADIKGELMHITVPSSAIQGFDETEMKRIVQFWDTLIRGYHDLAGYSKRGEWVIADVQPGVGAMHSGYPIVAHPDIVEPGHNNYLFTTDPGHHWGVFHEIGHNMQKMAWTPDQHIEITCNIFSMYGNYLMYGVGPWEVGWVVRAKEKMKKFLQDETEDITPGSGLGIYAQLARDFGFGAYKKVFRIYNKMKQPPQTNQQKIDTWFKEFSATVGYNLIPLYDLWRKHVTPSVQQEVQRLTPYLPEDEVTAVVSEKVSAIIAKYPGVVRKPEMYNGEDNATCANEDDEPTNEYEETQN